MNHAQIIAILREIREDHALTHRQKVALAWCHGRLLLPKAQRGWIDGEREGRRHGQESK